MIESVLVPTDGSERSERAAAHGIAIARAYDATVHALSVVETGALEFGDFAEGSEIYDALETGGRRSTAAIADRAADAGLSTVTDVRDGPAGRTILDYAEEADVDLLSMGTHGRTGVRRALLGSVTERVVRESERPVLTAHETEADPDTDYDTILVPTDGGPESRAAARYAIDFADRFDADVRAISVVDTTLTREGVVLEALSGVNNDAVQWIAAEAQAHGVHAETAVLEGPPADTVLDDAAEHDADLVAMGTHGRTGLDRFVTRSVAERVVRHADAPVLTVNRDVNDLDAAGDDD